MISSTVILRTGYRCRYWRIQDTGHRIQDTAEYRVYTMLCS